MSAYPVGATPSHLSGTYSQPYMIRNAGSVSVYLGTDSSVSPATREITLDPGAALNWPGDVDLWAVCDAGKTSQVELLMNGTGSFIPGPSNVTVDGSVSVDGGNVGITGPVQNRPQNNPDFLSSSVNPWSAAFGSPVAIAAIPVLTVSAYSSVILNILDNAAGLALSTGSMVSLVVTQYSSGLEVSRWTPQWVIGMCNSRLQIPVVGDSIWIQGSFIANGTGGGPVPVTLTIQAIGSHEVIPDAKYVSYNPGAFGNIPLGGYFNDIVATGTSVQRFVNSKNGPANFSTIPGASGVSGNASVFAVDSVGPSVNQLVGLSPPASSGASQSIILPMRPIQVFTRSISGGSMLSSLQQ